MMKVSNPFRKGGLFNPKWGGKWRVVKCVSSTEAITFKVQERLMNYDRTKITGWAYGWYFHEEFYNIEDAIGRCEKMHNLQKYREVVIMR